MVIYLDRKRKGEETGRKTSKVFEFLNESGVKWLWQIQQIQKSPSIAGDETKFLCLIYQAASLVKFPVVCCIGLFGRGWKIRIGDEAKPSKTLSCWIGWVVVLLIGFFFVSIDLLSGIEMFLVSYLNVDVPVFVALAGHACCFRLLVLPEQEPYADEICLL